MISANKKQSEREPLRIIVVDDDPIFRSLVVNKITRLAHEVVEAEDGAQAWVRLARETFHLALVDLEMPHLSGDELIRCIRGHPRTRHLPVIVITSRNDTDAVQRSLYSGATSFLTKPINWSMFGNHIDYLLRLHRAAEQGRIAQDEAQQTVRSMTEIVRSLTDEIGTATGRLAENAKHALGNALPAREPQQIADALEAVVSESERIRVELANAISAIQRAAGSPPDGDVKPNLRQAS
jgi:CheY-like chemotaxis protein